MEKITHRLVKKIALSIADILFPPVCLNCKASICDQKQFLCENCFAHIHLHSSFFCPHCGARLLSPRACHPQKPYLLAPATNYEDPMPAIIRHFKYGKLYPLEFFLSALLVIYLRSLRIPMHRYTITYIPLHFLKEHERGFNQSHVLAKRIADYFHVPCTSILSRTESTKPQARLSFQQRKENVSECFSCITPDVIKNKNIIIVDDVCTTGATLHEACMTLKKYGARQIICLVVARA